MSIKKYQRRLQSGISLIESLVAIVIMALGILGVLGVQMRTLADTQTGVRRAQAIRLIEDLSERVKANPNALGSAADYTIDFDDFLIDPDECAIASDFPGRSCDPKQLAVYDRDRWVKSVQANLPMGDATVFVSKSDPSQLGVMLAWRENERVEKTDNDGDADRATYRGAINASLGGGDVSCPDGMVCHLQYIQLTQRCLPVPDTTLVYCPE